MGRENSLSGIELTQNNFWDNAEKEKHSKFTVDSSSISINESSKKNSLRPLSSKGIRQQL
jgi:hypothetical protein